MADCTGHATIGVLAGADFEMARNHMGRSNLWYAAETPMSVSFPRCPWALDLSDSPFAGRGDEVGQFASGKGLDSLGIWYWESGFDRDPIHEGERIRWPRLIAPHPAGELSHSVPFCRFDVPKCRPSGNSYDVDMTLI